MTEGFLIAKVPVLKKWEKRNLGKPDFSDFTKSFPGSSMLCDRNLWKIAIAESLLETARDESAQKVTDFLFPFSTFPLEE